MGSNKAIAPPPPTSECCMCGDYGLSDELFRCTICLSRSQHRYCSDLYPKAESYRLCNWCLKEEGRKAMKESATCSNNSSNSYKNSSSSNETGMKLQRSSFSLHVNSPIKKQRSPDRSLQKKNLTGCTEESFRRTRSEDISNVRTRSKQVFRGKVRRYKLLEEVSS
ncbi:uncharacterized protein LOC131242404 [Magnolia sinica]|uniref:uncharacterized protein LOC131242404 n=1 Tax=Magnolia sinica TaxID=86752 RepID=UPI00265ACB51|nr:uncharacterized protein LOC131242404 [Magnolia sinica]